MGNLISNDLNKTDSKYVGEIIGSGLYLSKKRELDNESIDMNVEVFSKTQNVIRSEQLRVKVTDSLLNKKTIRFIETVEKASD